ncbi:MAG: hypothetical protein COW71_01185 [Ignavibacteriales bacterium CG18_big_fil_WC_8_21_14_2_50_31_20]|nr:MAG: hypothetical protein COW71_01185 [Ignavibacteriales bacterium CG18_big_fil_WC_8_21_14_2_50_31_20]
MANLELLSAEYSNFKIFEEVPIPMVLLIRNKNLHQSVNINYKKITVNRELKSLSIKLPSDVKKIVW